MKNLKTIQAIRTITDKDYIIMDWESPVSGLVESVTGSKDSMYDEKLNKYTHFDYLDDSDPDSDYYLIIDNQ